MNSQSRIVSRVTDTAGQTRLATTDGRLWRRTEDHQAAVKSGEPYLVEEAYQEHRGRERGSTGHSVFTLVEYDQVKDTENDRHDPARWGTEETLRNVVYAATSKWEWRNSVWVLA